jgi:hypothetical protein
VAEEKNRWWAWDSLTIRIRTKDAGREIYAWRRHQETVFTRWQDTLLVAHHGLIVTGCTVLAIDLRTGERLWKAPLRGSGRCPTRSIATR